MTKVDSKMSIAAYHKRYKKMEDTGAQGWNPPPSHEKIKVQWDASTALYSEFLAENNRELALSLANKIDSEQGDYIIEVGCGDGNLSLDLAFMKQKEA